MAWRLRPCVRGGEGGDVDVEQGVAVEDEEALREPLQARQHRPGRAPRRAVVDQRHPHRAEGPFVQKGFDLAGLVIDQDDRRLHARRGELAELPLQQRLAADLDQGLGPAVQARREPRALSASQDHGLHSAPSSCSTISAMAWRTAACELEPHRQPSLRALSTA